MSWALVLILFDEEVLLTSNYHGGAAKNKKDKDNKLKKLDPNIIDIIKGKKKFWMCYNSELYMIIIIIINCNKKITYFISGTVRSYYKNTYNESMFETNLNTRLSKFRKNRAWFRQDRTSSTT